MKALLIFDLDGTLIDSIGDLGTAANHALRSLGFPEHPVESYRRMVGNGVSKLMENALPIDHRQPRRIEEMLTIFTEYYNEHCTDLTRPYPGITELLRSLTKLGTRVAVASNKYQAAVDKIIHTLFPGIEWAALNGQREGIPLKPDPSVVFDILMQSPTPKQDVMMIGDSGVDMETARRACVDSVGVTWGFRPQAELEAFQARYIVNRPAEILTLLRN